MWGVKGMPRPADWLDLEPLRVLYEFDGPKIFICTDIPGNRYLAYLCAEDRERARFLVVPFSPNLELALTTGQISVRDALTRPHAWLFDLANDWRVLRCWEVDVDDLPTSVLPAPGVMLYAGFSG